MDKRLLLLLTISFLVLSLSIACNRYVSNGKNIQSNKNIIKTNGTVMYIELEGGFFGIIADDGNKYNPIDLPKDFQKNGLKVRFEGKLNPELFSIHQWGELIEITKINEL